jgi:hypothetical protein
MLRPGTEAVEETFAPGMSLSIVARRHHIYAGLKRRQNAQWLSEGAAFVFVAILAIVGRLTIKVTCCHFEWARLAGLRTLIGDFHRANQPAVDLVGDLRRFKLIRKSGGSHGTGRPSSGESSKCESDPGFVISIVVALYCG